MEKLKSIDYRVSLLILLALCAPVVSPNVGLPIAIISVSGLVAMKKYFDEQKKVEPTVDLQNEINGIKNQMSGIMIKNASRPEEMSKDLKRFF